jgi:aldose 1-epimerase
MPKPTLYLFAFSLMTIAACTNSDQATNTSNPSNDTATKSTTMIPDKKGFQDNIDGKRTDLYILKNKEGMTAAITNYGGRLVR